MYSVDIAKKQFKKNFITNFHTLSMIIVLGIYIVKGRRDIKDSESYQYQASEGIDHMTVEIRLT